MALRHPKGSSPHRRDVPVEAVFSSEMGRVPTHQLPLEEIAPEVAYQIVHDELPVFAFKLKDDIKNFTVFDVSAGLRERGWQVPAYTFPKNREDLAALRVVVRRGFTMDVADMLLDDLRKKVGTLEKLKAPVCGKDPGGFHH